jgi:alkylhydroperoxidase family enzyme
MARLPYVDPDNAPDALREAFAQLPAPLNIFKLLAHAEANVRPLLQLGGTILLRQQLDPVLRELAILQVAALSPGAEYEWEQHVAIGKAVGVTDAQVDALRPSAPAGDAFGSDAFDERQAAVLRFTTEAVERVGVSDEAWEAAAAFLSPRELVELLVAIGFYMMLARVMASCRIDMDPPMADAFFDRAERSLRDGGQS